jgi:phosphatidylinositol dimannoside acyltransferase
MRTGARPEAEPAADQAGLPDHLAHGVMVGAQWLGMHAPRWLGLRVADVFLRASLVRSPDQRRVVAANLARVLGHPPDSPLVRSATRECIRLYARYWYETFALRTMSVDEVNRRHTVEGREHLDAALAQGRGIVMALPHMGNWDAAGHWLCVNGYRMTAVAEELKPRAVFELFLRHRRALGMGIVPLGNGRPVGETLVRLLSQNEILTLVADRDLSNRGVDVEMFGARRKLPAGPAYLSLATGAPITACAVFTTEEGWHTMIGPPLEIERTGTMRADVTALTTRLAAEFERSISAAPMDWHMFQPAWEAEPPVPPAAS